MKNLIRPIILSGILALIASFTLAADDSQPEILYGIQSYKDRLEIRVKSSGCTKAEHFKLETTPEKEYEYLLVVRTQPDRCRAMPRIISIELAPLPEKTAYKLENLLQSS